MSLNYIGVDEINLEMKRLSNIFIPEYDISGIEILLGGRDGDYAAKSLLADKKIIFYEKYHENNIGEIKSTLLHELGHLVYAPSPIHGGRFREYYELLKRRQQHVDEVAIPDSYHKFVYAEPNEPMTYVYECSPCLHEEFHDTIIDPVCPLCKANLVIWKASL